MNSIKLVRMTASVVLLAGLGACNAGVDDATRIERAEQAMARNEYRAAGIELKNVLRSDPANIRARVLLGRVALEAGDPATAAKELQRARELGAESSDYVVPLARAMLAIDQPDDVFTLQAEGLDNPSDQADLNAVYGNAHLQKGDITQAESSFQAALALQTDHPDALVGMARVYLDNGDSKAAENSLRRVIAQHGDAHAAYAALGRLQMNSADYVDAESSFREAIQISSTPALRRERLTYLGGLVDVLLAQKKPGMAQDVATEMLNIAPDHPLSLYQAGRADFEAGELDNAIEKAQRVITAFPDYQPARLLLAAAAMSQENYALAEVHLRSVVSADPGNEQARRLLAQTQLSLGSPDEAFNVLEPLVQGSSADPQILAMAGTAGVRSGQTEKGLEFLSRGIAAGGEDPVVQMQVATSFIAAGQIDQAIALLEEMPDKPGPQRDYLLILARLRGGDVEGARADAAAVLARNPDNGVGHRLMGSFHMAVSENALARDQFEAAAKLDPDDVGAVINLARLDTIDGDLAGAEKRYDALLSRSPGDLIALLGLSQLAEKRGDQDRAVEILETARDANPEAVQPALLLAHFYLRTNRPELAEQRADQALAIAPNSVDALNMVGLLQLQTNRHSEALGTFERTLQHGPNSVDTHFYLAQARLKLGMNEAARRSLDKVLELNPRHLGAKIAVTRMEGLAGNYSAALKLVESLKGEYPDRPEADVVAGDIHIMRGHYNDAIAAYDKAAQLLPTEAITIKRYQARNRAGHADSHLVLEEWLSKDSDNLHIRVELAQAYEGNGLTEKAVVEYGRVLEQDKDNVVALNNLAWLYAEAGGADNLRQGIDIAKRAHELMPGVGQVTDTYGWLLLKQGEVSEATTWLRQAANQAPDDPDIRYHLAVALQRNGASGEAKDLLDAILTDGGGFSSRDDAKALLEELGQQDR
ncbi:MAG: PEP-CTERM system TPR-repeat protein PrsT [Gammaproteobacteria bacterium]|nr:PEP-CTERM system TPR-repeat protein PrsT [Gammaproteobacteria bacterium]MDH3767247.1 PEP-CTERM system TPR-repeat protein PrsT [Gammaproteobacteria bacterium]